MAYKVELLPSARREFDRLPGPIRVRIGQPLLALVEVPRQPGVVKLQVADNLWRIRVGHYRVVYAIVDDKLTVLVVRIAHRKDVYRGT